MTDSFPLKGTFHFGLITCVVKILYTCLPQGVRVTRIINRKIGLFLITHGVPSSGIYEYLFGLSSTLGEGSTLAYLSSSKVSVGV